MACKGRFWAFGLPFYIFRFRGEAQHSTRVPLFVIEHLSPRTGDFALRHRSKLPIRNCAERLLTHSR